MSAALQAKYLRVLQDGGGPAPRRRRREIKVDVRVVAATNKDPPGRVEAGDVPRGPVLPSQRVQRRRCRRCASGRDDIPLLVAAFVEEFAVKYDRSATGLTDEAVGSLRRHAWPGNVRELRNCLERAVIGCTETRIPTTALPLPFLPGASPRAAAPAAPTPGKPESMPTLDEAERVLIMETLAAHSNNRTRAARSLGISLKTLHNRLRRYGAFDRGRA